MKFPASRPLAWLVAFLSGSLFGLSLRFICFFIGILVVRALGGVIGWLGPVFPSLDPVYTRAMQHSLDGLQIQGTAVVAPLGEWLHAALPSVFVPAAKAHWAFARLVVEPGSPVLARLVAAGIAHAIVLSAGMLLVRSGWRHRSTLVVAGVAMQIQIAIGILGSQPSIRELESTGLSFAANALLPSIASRSTALSDGSAQAWPPLVSAALVAIALLVGYLPMGLALVLRDPRRRITFGIAGVVLLGAAACAGVLTEQATISGPVEVAAPIVTGAEVEAPLTLAEVASVPHVSASDRWFDEPVSSQPVRPSKVEIVGADYHYQYLINGQAQVIKGMGLNTQYSQLLSPEDRAARIDSDMAQLSALGVNTVLGWDPAEFDDVLLDAAQRHHIGVVMPFDLDPEADYTDPAVRQRLHDEALAWVARYRNHPALRMWGLGNEVLHKIVHPAWVGPQDPQRVRQAEAFSDWLVQTADAIHALDPNHPVTYREAEDAFVDWLAAALDRSGAGPRPWFALGTNCYTPYLSDIVDHWAQKGMPTALWVSEFAPGGIAVPDRPDGFATMWGYVRRSPDSVLGGAVYAWTRNGPEGVDRDFGLTDDGQPVDGRSLEMLSTLFHAD
jgi:hypothetical protein